MPEAAAATTTPRQRTPPPHRTRALEAGQRRPGRQSEGCQAKIRGRGPSLAGQVPHSPQELLVAGPVSRHGPTPGATPLAAGSPHRSAHHLGRDASNRTQNASSGSRCEVHSRGLMDKVRSCPAASWMPHDTPQRSEDRARWPSTPSQPRLSPADKAEDKSAAHGMVRLIRSAWLPPRPPRRSASRSRRRSGSAPGLSRFSAAVSDAACPA